MAYRDPKIVGTASQITVTESTNSTTLALAGPAGVTTLTAHGVLIGEGTSPIAATSAGLSGQVLQSGGAAADPVYSTTTYPSTTAQGDLLYASSDNTVISLAKNTSSTRYLSNTGVNNSPAWAQIDAVNGFTELFPVANGGLNSAGITGIVAGSGPGNPYNGRTLTGTANSLDITNALGDTGNPTIAFSPTVLRPTQPCFLARVSGTNANVTGDSTSYTVIFDNEIFDLGANYNPATGIFTAPVAGRYVFQTTVTLTGILVTHTQLLLMISNIGISTYTKRGGALFTIIDAAGLVSVNSTIVINLTLNQTVSVILQVIGGTKTVGVYGQNISTWYSGCLVT